MDIINYSNTFSCCGKAYLTELEYVKTKYYGALNTLNKKYNDKSYKNEIFGKIDNNWNYVNYIHYFWTLMTIMYNEKKMYENQFTLEIIEEEVDATYFRDEYDLECIRRTMKCIGIDILPLLSLIGLNYVVSYIDGIDYMAIIPNPTTSPDFRVS